MLTKIQRKGMHYLQACASRVRVIALFGLLVTSSGACAAVKPSAVLQAPTYGLEEALVFSDSFRPELFEVMQSEPPERDPLLGERTEAADAVFVVRCVSITRDKSESRRAYGVVVVKAGDVLGGEPPSGPITLPVPAQSPGSAWLDTATKSWLGTRFILFMRQYADGPHFYATVDTPAVRLAISRSTPLRRRKTSAAPSH